MEVGLKDFKLDFYVSLDRDSFRVTEKVGYLNLTNGDFCFFLKDRD